MFWQDYIDETSDNVADMLEEWYGSKLPEEDRCKGLRDYTRLLEKLAIEDDVTGVESCSYTCDSETALLNVRELVWDPAFKQYMKDNGHSFDTFMNYDPERADAEARYYALYELDLEEIINSLIAEKRIKED